MVERLPFWQRKGLTEMNKAEWESLCDGCGKCCLVKLEDDSSGELHYTDVVCRYYDQGACECSVYSRRSEKVVECLRLSLDDLDNWRWLPSSCAYLRIADGKPLPEWHHLVCGDRTRVHDEGHSIRGRVISEKFVHPDQLQDMIVRWVEADS